MNWLDIAAIVFACTAANHLGLVDAVENAIRHKLPVVNCCKCASFWMTLAYCGLKVVEFDHFAVIVAIAFLASICAVWLELFMGFIDTLYDKAYERIFNTSAVTTADRHEGSADTKDTGDTQDKVSKM